MRYAQQPQFTNPWVSAPASQSQLYATSLPQDSKPQYSSSHMPNVSSAYSAGQVSASPMATGILPLDPELLEQSNLLFAQDILHAPRPYGAPYSTTAPHNHNAYPPTSAPQYASEVLQRQSPYGYQQQDRRGSHPSVDLNMLPAEPMEGQELRQGSLVDFNHRLGPASESERASFSDALDASRGMVQMSQTDMTPRNIYGSHQHSSRSSSDSYGFPSMHSSRSSISSTSTYPSYYPSSVSEASVGDYGSASESVDSSHNMSNSRTLPRPSGLIAGQMPPAPQSMMGQFSSKVSSSSQKKHKCKICDKRFTRPSSLQTHMYSHTGEKRKPQLKGLAEKRHSR